MPFDWREFLIVAHGWRNDPSESVKRTCLGRTYYYVYNLGLIKARAMNFQGKLPGLHNQLWRWRQSQTDTNIRQMGVWGARMHSLRIAADYYDTPIPGLTLEVQTQFVEGTAI